MITAGGVMVDVRLYETVQAIREGLLLFRPEVADLSAQPVADAPGSGTGAFITGIHRAAGYSTTDLVRRLRLAAPALGIFVVAKRGELPSRERQRLATLGMDRLLYFEELNKRRLGGLVERRLGASAPARALVSLSQIQFAPAVAPLVQWTLRNSCYRHSIEDAAELFDLASRTIRRRLDQQGIPGYRVLRTLGLELHALELEVCRGHKRTESARRLGYRDGTKLSRLLQPDSFRRCGEPTWFADLRNLYL